MTTIRHFTASAIVFDDHERVLLVHHNKLGQWLYPGGHVDPNEDPAQAALREVLEETGVTARIVCDPPFAHPAVTVHAPPYTILEMQVSDSTIGIHRHIDLVYVLQALSGELTAQLEEVSATQWVPIADVAGLNTPAELPTLVADAAQWAKTRR
ncbi:NUDIX domain-containing protein [Frankia sp. Cppng1_Ct_nod]|uniref:NUDIX hydrolase n=1 Tax=Frankia sp. Cppng1_Ct_nod TaxID=2897162 RepID=UPI0010419532|nr:NUDIX domain-containing protein [Frankia sp. Cppng1_Ct_nod]